jgi:hypothetical protein
MEMLLGKAALTLIAHPLASFSSRGWRVRVCGIPKGPSTYLPMGLTGASCHVRAQTASIYRVRSPWSLHTRELSVPREPCVHFPAGSFICWTGFPWCKMIISASVDCCEDENRIPAKQVHWLCLWNPKKTKSSKAVYSLYFRVLAWANRKEGANASGVPVSARTPRPTCA